MIRVRRLTPPRLPPCNCLPIRLEPWNGYDWTFEALETHYKTLFRYLNLKDMGMVLVAGCGTPSVTQHSKFPQQAYNFGYRFK